MLPRIAGCLAIAVVAVLTSPPTASAGGVCFSTFEFNLLTVLCDADGSTLTLARDGIVIEVDGQPVNPAAGGGDPASTSNTSSISIDLGDGIDTLNLDFSNGLFESIPLQEIDISVIFGPGSDSLVITGTIGDDTIVVGDAGVDVNGDGDLDVSTDESPPLTVLGGAGDDWIDLNAYPDIGDPYPNAATLHGGPDDDILTGGSGTDLPMGEEGNDLVNGRAGQDQLGDAGGSGSDHVDAVDGAGESVSCGAEEDSAAFDDFDGNALCEHPYRDGDQDGRSTPMDCDDTSVTIRPGLPEIRGNDVDENCDGKLKPVDADRDGVAKPDDCDDTSSKIKPGALEKPGNKVDENCDGLAKDLADGSLDGVVSRVSLGMTNKGDEVKKFVISNMAPDVTVSMRCVDGDGLPCELTPKGFWSNQDPDPELYLTGYFENLKLRPGTVITVRVSAPGTIGRFASYTTRKGKQPRKSVLCLPPGTSQPQAC